ncbi:MAG: oligosaccharide flippase family protein, partial [Patescibacteria group bacterium]
MNLLAVKMLLNIKSKLKRRVDSLGRFLHIDAAYLISGSFWLSIGKIINMATSLLLSILYARYISKTTYGDYRYVLSIIGMFGIFTLPGIATSLQRAIARGHEKSYARGAKLIFIGSFGISICSLLACLFFYSKNNIGLAIGFLIAALLVPFSEGLGTWRGYFEGKGEFKKKTSLNTFGYISYAFFMVSAVSIIFYLNLSNTSGFLLLLTFYFLSSAIPNTILFRRTIKSIPENATEEEGAIRYGLNLSILNIPATIGNYLDAVLLHYFLGANALAIYSFAIAPLEQLKAFLSTIPDVAFQKLSRRTNNENSLRNLQATLPGKAIKASAITGLIIIVYILAAPYLFQILFPRYIQSIYYSQVFA